MQMAWWRFIFLGLSGFSALTATAGLADTHLRIPVRDDVYLQEIGRKVAAPFSLTSVAVYEGKVYAGSSAGLHQLNGENWAPVSAVSAPVSRLVVTSKALWLISSQGLHRNQSGLWMKISDQPANDVAEHLGEVIVAAGRRLWRVAGDRLKPVTGKESPFNLTRVVSHNETLYVQGPENLTLFAGDRFGSRNVWNWGSQSVSDWGELPSRTLRDLLSQGSGLYIATSKGLGIIDYEPFTPAGKAAHYERHLEEWGQKRLGLVHKLEWDRTLEIERIEQVPWFNFIYGALTGNDCEAEVAVAHLREWSLDLVIHAYQNSHRADLQTPPGYTPYSGGTRAFSPREREPMRADNWSMRADGGGSQDVFDPGSWLLAYWMGRYHGFIGADEAAEPARPSGARSPGRGLGAKPYAGPPRPKGF